MASDQASREITIAHLFLAWLRAQDGVELGLTRAEERFSELANRTRWEVVAERSDKGIQWIGIEVKGLVNGPGERQANDWRKLVEDVNRKLADNLPGKYVLYAFPTYTFDQKQRQCLFKCLVRVIRQISFELEPGDQEDIGPQVADSFTDWPHDKRTQPRIDSANHRLLSQPHKLMLLKTSEEESFLVALPFIGGWVEPLLNQAIREIFEKGSAKEQLRLAKTKGASKTALLLDDRIDFDPEIVRAAIRTIGLPQGSGIDEVFVVSTSSGGHVAMVWP